MLVKFLSFSATVIGTKRYNAVFLSCLALVLSIIGVTTVALTKESGAKHGPASAVEQDADVDAQEFTPQFGGIRKQVAKEEAAKPAESQAPAVTPETSTTPPETPTKPVTPAVDIVFSSTNNLRLTADDTVTITAKASDDSTLTWAVTAVNPDPVSGVKLVNQESTSGFSFQVQTTKEAVKGTYTFSVTAKDTVRNINIAKTITVTVE